jgi:hypothetical protein
MYNVLVVGQTGHGKSSVVNLITGQNMAKTSPGDDLVHCTEHYAEYPISLGERQFQVFDTFGFLEPDLDPKLYAKAIADTYNAVNALKERGGIDMLLYCVREDKTNDLQKMNLENHYRLLHEVLCDEEVPIALVVTNRGNANFSAEHYKSIFTARNITCVDCVCAKISSPCGPDEPVSVDTNSQEAVRKLLMKCCGTPKSRSRMQRIMRAAKNIAGRGRSLKGKYVSTLLTQRCNMKSDTAAQVVEALNLQSPSSRLYRAPYARGKCWFLVSAVSP